MDAGGDREPARKVDCLQCGACCFSQLDRYVRVTGDDHERLGSAANRQTIFIGHRCYMRMNEGHCAALQITLQDGFSCAVYARRPAICRDIAVGGAACEAEIIQKKPRAEAVLRNLSGSSTLINTTTLLVPPR